MMRVEYEDRLRPVSSRQNSRVKELRRLFYEASPNQRGEIAIEGVHLLQEAIRSGLRVETVFFAESAKGRADKLLPQLSSHVGVLLLPDQVFAGAVPSETPQGVAGIVKVKGFDVEDVFSPPPALIVVCAGIQDPGNLGTIVRSAEAFGATGVLLGDGSVSQWNWKAIRASAGSMFRLPAVKTELAAAVQASKLRGLWVLATASHKGSAVSGVDLRAPLAIVVGNEGAGIPQSILALADQIVAIPQAANVESLNAGVAASVILYEAARQRSVP